MKYRVTIEGREREVDVSLTPDGRASIALDGVPVDAEVMPIPGGVHLRIAGRVYDVLAGGTPEETHLAVGPHRATAQVQSERARAQSTRRKGGAAGPSAKELRAPMPGRIIEVFVKVGDQVEPNQALLIIEAMKMQNELRAVGAAKIASVEVKQGQSVEGNVVLLRFE
jgi:biotin carboxyl carrier protein